MGAADNANAFTRVNGMRAAGIANLSDPALSLFHVCGSAKARLPFAIQQYRYKPAHSDRVWPVRYNRPIY